MRFDINGKFIFDDTTPIANYKLDYKKGSLRLDAPKEPVGDIKIVKLKFTHPRSYGTYGLKNVQENCRILHDELCKQVHSQPQDYDHLHIHLSEDFFGELDSDSEFYYERMIEKTVSEISGKFKSIRISLSEFSGKMTFLMNIIYALKENTEELLLKDFDLIKLSKHVKRFPRSFPKSIKKLHCRLAPNAANNLQKKEYTGLLSAFICNAPIYDIFLYPHSILEDSSLLDHILNPYVDFISNFEPGKRCYMRNMEFSTHTHPLLRIAQLSLRFHLSRLNEEKLQEVRKLILDKDGSKMVINNFELSMFSNKSKEIENLAKIINQTCSLDKLEDLTLFLHPECIEDQECISKLCHFLKYLDFCPIIVIAPGQTLDPLTFNTGMKDFEKEYKPYIRRHQNILIYPDQWLNDTMGDLPKLLSIAKKAMAEGDVSGQMTVSTMKLTFISSLHFQSYFDALDAYQKEVSGEKLVIANKARQLLYLAFIQFISLSLGSHLYEPHTYLPPKFGVDFNFNPTDSQLEDLIKLLEIDTCFDKLTIAGLVLEIRDGSTLGERGAGNAPYWAKRYFDALRCYSAAIKSLDSSPHPSATLKRKLKNYLEPAVKAVIKKLNYLVAPLKFDTLTPCLELPAPSLNEECIPVASKPFYRGLPRASSDNQATTSNKATNLTPSCRTQRLKM